MPNPILQAILPVLSAYRHKRAIKKKKTESFPMLPGEAWYGMQVNKGLEMPFTKKTRLTIDIDPVSGDNQAAPLLVSTKGRFVWCESGFRVRFCGGTVTLSTAKQTPTLYEGYQTLRGAYLAAQKQFFPPDGKYPDERMFQVPQYCTWIQLDNNQTAEGILSYAKSIVAKGMPTGELILDDGWQQGFGDWRFHNEKIPNPKALMTELKEMGFDVILWICPFVSPTAPDFLRLKNENALVKEKNGEIAMRTWWNGKDAVLDLSNPYAVTWFQQNCDFLMHEYGVAGFKQDAGDPMYYRDSDVTFGGVDANTQCMLWADTAKEYRFNELRACFKGGGFGLAQRLADRSHSWGRVGLASLVPNALAQGILGYPFTCPDMIGGGQIGDFRGRDPNTFDHELFVRYAECAALMPMMQFSLDVWALPNQETAALCQKQCDLHLQFSDYILALAKESAQTGEPIVRYLAYEFPNESFETVTDAFMLGSRYLVAPVLQKGVRQKTIRLPLGNWKYVDGTPFAGGKEITVPTPLGQLPIFENVSN